MEMLAVWKAWCMFAQAHTRLLSMRSLLTTRSGVDAGSGNCVLEEHTAEQSAGCEPTDESLLARIKQDDKEALGDLFRRYMRRVRGIATRILTDVAQAKGLQQLYTKQAPQLLKALREMALIQSVESSNRTEGVTVAPERLAPLVVGHAKPRDRSEEEIRGYRRALSLIHADTQKLEITPDFLKLLHQTTHEGAADAGQWKQKENEIIEFRESAPPTIRFRPVSAAETPAAIEELCLSYRAILNQHQIQPLVGVDALEFDFLCIHPFRDGNGRISRLLTLLGLYQHTSRQAGLRNQAGTLLPHCPLFRRERAVRGRPEAENRQPVSPQSRIRRDSDSRFAN
jgi:hypothetical protein